MVMPNNQTKSAIAADIRPEDNPVEISHKLVGHTETQLLTELFGYFNIPSDFINHVFGNLYPRDVLTQRERKLSAVAALCALNRTNELKSHIIAAIHVGASKAEIAEVILQMSTYRRNAGLHRGTRHRRQVFEKSAGGARTSDQLAFDDKTLV